MTKTVVLSDPLGLSGERNRGVDIMIRIVIEF